MGDSGAPIAPIKESASPTEEKVPPSQGQATVAPSTSTTPQSSSSAPFTDTIPAECTVPTSSAPVSAPLSLPTKPKTPIKSPEVSEDVLGGDNMMDIMASMTAAESHSLSAENTAMDMGFGSLLPGLESYANAGNDDGIIEIPSADDDFLTNNTNDHNNDLNSGAQAENGKSTAGDMTVHPPHHNSAQMHHDAGRTDAPMDDVGPTESTFDDLFVGVADFSGNGDELLLQGADLKELDDVWLNRF